MNEANRSDAARKKSLGELGELFAIKALVDKGYDRIRNLNDDRFNEPFADLIAEKDGFRYAITVKARNKFMQNGKLNSRYNLGDNAYEKAAAAELKHSAIACWLAIQFDATTFSVFFGMLNDLDKRNAIPVNLCEAGEVGQIWELNKRHYFDFRFYSNQRMIS